LTMSTNRKRPGGLVVACTSMTACMDDVENLSQIWAVAPALVKSALRDDRRSQFNKEPPWKRIAKARRWAM
jgi:hypothetical protein